jgi:geranylgeranyl diphosphate synthase type I
LIEAHLRRTIDRYRGSSPVYEMVRYHFGYSDGASAQHGKRLRPQLLLRVALAEGARPEAALDAAVAVEILHNYSLVHDDIEDGDRVRHGRPTVWARYGVAHGINAGDTLCALSYLTLLETAAQPSDRSAAMTAVLHRANLAMCAGQALDIAFESRGEVAMADYRTMIEGKTAALFGAACELGALSAGAASERARAYAELGSAYGVAFQIRDDVLGTWGAPDVTGKPSGADIARRKWTFPVVWALSQPPSEERELVAGAYGAGARVDAAAVARVVAALGAMGAREAADEAADRALDAAADLRRARGLDPDGSVAAFLARGARRVA